MKLNFAIFLIFSLTILQVTSIEEKYDRKAAKGLEDDENSSKEDSSSDTEEEKLITMNDDELNFPSSGIKIIQAPDLSKDNDGKKLSETLAMMLESQEKWIQKYEEELEEMNKNEVTEEEPVREKTAEEIEGES
jgi:hypothetical protein